MDSANLSSSGLTMMMVILQLVWKIAKYVLRWGMAIKNSSCFVNGSGAGMKMKRNTAESGAPTSKRKREPPSDISSAEEPDKMDD